jgi:hypothetical protein
VHFLIGFTFALGVPLALLTVFFIGAAVGNLARLADALEAQNAHYGIGPGEEDPESLELEKV